MTFLLLVVIFISPIAQELLEAKPNITAKRISSKTSYDFRAVLVNTQKRLIAARAGIVFFADYRSIDSYSSKTGVKIKSFDINKRYLWNKFSKVKISEHSPIESEINPFVKKPSPTFIAFDTYFIIFPNICDYNFNQAWILNLESLKIEKELIEVKEGIAYWNNGVVFGINPHTVNKTNRIIKTKEWRVTTPGIDFINRTHAVPLKLLFPEKNRPLFNQYMASNGRHILFLSSTPKSPIRFSVFDEPSDTMRYYTFEDINTKKIEVITGTSGSKEFIGTWGASQPKNLMINNGYFFNLVRPSFEGLSSWIIAIVFRKSDMKPVLYLSGEEFYDLELCEGYFLTQNGKQHGGPWSVYSDTTFLKIDTFYIDSSISRPLATDNQGNLFCFSGDTVVYYNFFTKRWNRFPRLPTKIDSIRYDKVYNRLYVSSLEGSQSNLYIFPFPLPVKIGTRP